MKKILLSILVIPGFVNLFSQSFQLDTLLYNGDIDKRINYVFLGDGYLDSEMDQFTADAENISSILFDQEPFKQYRGYFNAFAIEVPSNETGAALDPENLIDNYFGSTFWYAGIERLLVPTNSTAVYNVLSENFPSYDQVIMIVNSTKYGGSGGWIATSSVHSSAPEITFHELGHSFSNLGDEYWAGQQYASERANRTQESDPAIVKWKNWLNINSIGIYEYESPGEGWYRPHQGCKMRYLGSPFCSVCREEVVKTIQNLVSPLDSYTPMQSAIDTTDLPVTFTLGLTPPVPNTLRTTWHLNSILVREGTDTMVLQASDLMEGLNLLSVNVVDTTTWIKSTSHTKNHTYTIDWSIDNGATGIRITNIGKIGSLHIFPNPVKDMVRISFTDMGQGLLELSVINLNGMVLLKRSIEKGAGDHDLEFDLGHLPQGVYLVRVVNDKGVLTKQLIKQ